MVNKRNKCLPILFLLPSMCGTILFVAIPFLGVIFNSLRFRENNQMGMLSNYKAVLKNSAFALAMKNTFLFSFFSVIVLLIISALLSCLLLFYIKDENKKKLHIGMTIPIILPIVTIAIFEKILFDNYGIVNGILDSNQLPTINWFESEWGVIILTVSFIWKNVGIAVILWNAGIKNISISIVEASKIDGASKIQCFAWVIFPNLKKTVYIILLYFFIQSFKGFREVYLISGEYPFEGIYFLQNLFNNWFRDMEIGNMAAGTIINVIIFVLVIIILQIITREKKNEK